jgi:hypothetical protein
MPFDILKQVLAKRAQENLYGKSQLGQQELISDRLKNQALAMQIDQMIPLQIMKLGKEIDNILTNPQEMAQRLLEEQEKQKLIQRTQELGSQLDYDRQMAVGKQAGEYGLQEARIRAATSNPDMTDTVDVTIGPDGKPDTVKHKWVVDKLGRRINYIGPVGTDKPAGIPVLSRTGQATPWTVLVGQVSASGTELTGVNTQLKQLMTDMYADKRFGMDWAKSDTATPESVAWHLGISGFPYGKEYEKFGTPQELMVKYPDVYHNIVMLRKAGAFGDTAPMPEQQQAPTPPVEQVQPAATNPRDRVLNALADKLQAKQQNRKFVPEYNTWFVRKGNKWIPEK